MSPPKNQKKLNKLSSPFPLLAMRSIGTPKASASWLLEMIRDIFQF
jgi:WD40 repeat protein